MKQVFNQHHAKGIESFEFFYAAQCMWEDTMAESVALNIEDDQMIALARNGHIIRKFGIPDRKQSRTFICRLYMDDTIKPKTKKKMRRFSGKHEKVE